MLTQNKQRPLELNEDRLFSSDPVQREISRELYAEVKDLPIISPHGHTDPTWFSANEKFGNPTELFLAPDHYIYRMLFSQGVSLEKLGVPSRSGKPDTDPLEAWRLFADHYYLFRGTPTRMWLDHVFAKVFGIDVRLDRGTADHYYEVINTALQTDEYRPRALFDRFNIEAIATTEGPLDSLEPHQIIQASDWDGKVISAYRPDNVVDPEHEGFVDSLKAFGELTGEDTMSWKGYLQAHRKRREDFITVGTTSSDHGHPTARTADLSAADAEALFDVVKLGKASAEQAELFRAQMLTEMARISLDDGLVLQIHPGARRNHNHALFESHGRDKGADVPSQTEYVQALKPLLNKFGNDPRLSMIVFTLDETTYSRELAPLAGHYPAMKLGPAWWFHDSPEGMRRFREMTTETAGFYNTVGFNDDTRAFLSIPARHDVARRVDCAFLARLVAEHRLPIDEAHEVVVDLAYNLAKRAYKL